MSHIHVSFLSQAGDLADPGDSVHSASLVRSVLGRSLETPIDGEGANGNAEGGNGQSSASFICTVTSAMMGSTLMCLPWAFENAGLVASLIMISIVGAVSFYTCSVILRWGAPPTGNFSDFSDLCSHYLGTWSKHVANATSVGVCVGVLAAYHVLMASSLNNVILSLGDLSNSKVTFLCCGTEDFEYFVSSVIIGVCVFPLMCFKTIGFLMTFASYGGISVVYNCCFIIGNALMNWPSEDVRAGRKIKESGDLKDFGVFFGTLGLSLFVHNLLLQMSSGHSQAVSNPAVIKRDVAISYCFAVVFYIAVGAVPAVVFQLGHGSGGSPYTQNLKNGQLPQNILLAYSRDSWGAIIGQSLLMLQILAVYPLIATVIRRQFFSSMTGSQWPGWPKALSFSFCLVIFTTAVSSVYPKPGNVVGYVGVYTAIVYMLGLPILVHIKASKTSDRGNRMSTVIHALIWVIMSFAFLLQFL